MAKLCNECGGKHYAKGKCKLHYKMPSSLNPKAIAKPKKPISKLSKKMLSNLRVYRKLRDKYLEENPICEFNGCNSNKVELHHKKTREYYLCDVSIFMSVCRQHHKWIDENDKESRKLGYLLQSI